MSFEGGNSTHGDDGKVLLGTGTASATSGGSVMIGVGSGDGGMGGSGLIWWVRVFPLDDGEGRLSSYPVFHCLGTREWSRRLAVTRWSVLANMLRYLRSPVQAGVAEHCTWLLDVP